mgnify:CR=1 FL=1
MEKLILNKEIELDRNTLLDYFFDNFELNYSFEINQKRRIAELISLNNTSVYKLNSDEIPKPIFQTYQDWKYPVFYHINSENDFLINTFLFLSGYLERINPKRDNHERFMYEESIQYKYDFIHIPVVNIYFELIYQKAINNNIKIYRKKFESPIVFTHDIDQLRSGWFEDVKFELSNFRLKSFLEIPTSIIKKTFGLKDSYHKAFENMLLIDKKNKINSISFFMSKKSHKDADYDITKSKYSKVVNQSKQKTQCEFHPGYDTCDNEKEFETQIKILDQIKSQKTIKVRQHFLKFDIIKTPKIHELNNIEQDFSLGFPEMYGFRNSIASPFYLFNFEEQKKYKTVEIPLFFMDSTILDYIKTPFEEECNKLLTVANKTVLDFNCNFSILFHNSAFSNKKYKGLISMYKKLILLSKNNGCSNKEV